MTSIPNQAKNYPSLHVANESDLGDNHTLKKQLDLLGHNKHVVEFGCATGYFAQFLKQRGCYVVGVELNPEAAKTAESYCDQVLVADLDFVSIPDILHDRKFEVAVFGDVLEHLRDPWRVLEETRQILQPGGYVIASIPNIAHGAVRLALLQGSFEYADLGLLDNTHLRFFTRKTVQELFERAGYVVDVIERTVVPVLSGSALVPTVEQHLLSDELIHQVEQASDADTLQFVLRAFPMTPEGKYAALHLKYAEAIEQTLQLQTALVGKQESLEQAQMHLEQTQTRLEQTQTRLEQTQTQLEQTQTQLEQTRSQAHQMQGELQQTQQGMGQVTAIVQWMETSKFWKLRLAWLKLRQWVRRSPHHDPVHVVQPQQTQQTQQDGYELWLQRHTPQLADIPKLARAAELMPQKPLISVVMPVFNAPEPILQAAIESVISQVYPYWELCIADDASTLPSVRQTLERYQAQDSRIKVTFRSTNGNISCCSNSALELATGDYIALLDHDDELAIDALFENAKLINQHPDADFIYSDEDKINTDGKRLHPFFKPDWSPDYFHACMYTCHLGVFRTSLIRALGGFRTGYDGAQDYDLVLRVVEKTKQIYHLPKVLYHWRIIPSSVTAGGKQVKPWAYIAARKALEAMLERSPYPGWVEESTDRAGFWRVRRSLIGNPLISIIIPSAGKAMSTPNGTSIALKHCLRSLQEHSTYRNFEVVLVDGYDIPDETLTAVTQLFDGETANLHLVRCKEPFNFAHRINQGAAKANGEFLLLLNDDTEVITPDWLESMLEFSQQKDIGAVGAKLLFPDGKIQHMGVMVLSGNPGHAFHGFDGNHPGYFCSNFVNRNYLAVTAACLMIRRDIFQQVGGMDEIFPLNYNDVDFCLKVHQAGYRNVVTPYARLIHYESISRKAGLQPNEWETLNQKWKGYFEALNGDPYYNPNLSQQAVTFEL